MSALQVQALQHEAFENQSRVAMMEAAQLWKKRAQAPLRKANAEGEMGDAETGPEEEHEGRSGLGEVLSAAERQWGNAVGGMRANRGKATADGLLSVIRRDCRSGRAQGRSSLLRWERG